MNQRQNLHPVWQVKLSELIVKLNKLLGIQFLINSHSSNFIEGIKLYSELHETEKVYSFLSHKLRDSNS